MITLPAYRNRWSDEDIAFLTEHWGKETPEQIAKQMNRSVVSITSRASLLRLSKVNHCADYHREIVLMARQGKTIKEMSEAIGVSYRSMQYYLQENDIKTIKQRKREF